MVDAVVERPRLCAQYSITSRPKASVTTKHSDNLGILDALGEPQGSLKDALTGVTDFAINAYFVRGFWKEKTYPFYSGSLKIATLKNPATHLKTVVQMFNFNAWLAFIMSNIVCCLHYYFEVHSGTASFSGCSGILTNACKRLNS